MKNRLRPMGIGIILDNTFAVLRERFWAFQGVNFLSILPALIFVAITVVLVLVLVGLNNLERFNDWDNLFIRNGITSLFLIGLLVVDIIAVTIGGIYLAYGNVKLFSAGLHYEKIPFKEVFKGIKGKRWRFFSMYMLAALIYLPYLAGFIIMGTDQAVLGGILILFGLILLLGVFFCLSITPMVVLLEDKGLFASIKRAFQLMAGYRWRIFGRLIVVYLLFYAMFYGFYIFGLLGALLCMIKHFIAYIIAGLLGIMGLMVISVMTSFYYGPFVSIYYDLLIRKEGYDIQLQLAEETNPVPAISGERSLGD